jgi:hypothetical protein
MLVMKLKQLQFESDMWKRQLGFMTDENILLKNRISEVLKNGFNRNLLEQLENFQTRFIKEDELIILLRNQVAELDNNLQAEYLSGGRELQEITDALKILRANIGVAEKHFGRLKLEFYSYLFSHMN